MSTAPYDERAGIEIADTLDATCVAKAVTAAGEPIETLDNINGVLTFDEAWAPHAQLELSFTSENPRAIDPRRGARVHLFLGYRYAGGRLDEHLAADLQTTEWSGPRDSALSLTAHSAELRLMDYVSLGYTYTYPLGSKIVDIIDAQITRALGVVPLVRTYNSKTIYEPLTINAASNMWDIIKALSDQADVWTYADALGRWHIIDRPVTVGASSVQVRSGPAGILNAVEDGMSREKWGNTVALSFAGGQTAYATRSIGPLSTAEVGMALIRVTTSAPWPGSTAGQEAAESMLRLVITRGDSQSLTALAAYWLRPGDTITTPDSERVIVSRIRFTFPDSLMAITTRKVDNA